MTRKISTSLMNYLLVWAEREGINYDIRNLSEVLRGHREAELWLERWP